MSANTSVFPYNHFPDLSNIDFSAIEYDWTLNDWPGILKTFFVVFCSFAFFRILQYTVRWYLFGKCTFRTFDYFKFGRGRRRRNVPPSTELEAVPPNKKWRTSNEAVSLIHSVVSGVWALYAITYYPKLATEMNVFTHPVPKFLVYVSFGYIVHDLIDLLINERSLRIMELLFHHVVVICAFMFTLVTDKFLGVVILGLLMEINSVFLHSRSLMNLYRQPKTSTAFKFVALLNILTFMVFRMAVSVYLLYWQLSNVFSMPWIYAVITFVVIASLTITNSVLCYRVLAADGLLGSSRARRPAAGTVETKSSEDDEDEEYGDDTDDEGREDRNPRRTSSTTATQTNFVSGEDVALNTNAPTEVVIHTIST